MTMGFSCLITKITLTKVNVSSVSILHASSSFVRMNIKFEIEIWKVMKQKVRLICELIVWLQNEKMAENRDM